MTKIKKFGEVFTPMNLINNDLLAGIDYSNPNNKFFEPSFGDGRILLRLKEELLKFHAEEHIISNMLYGIEIQEELYSNFIKEFNPNGFKHNLLNMSALLIDGDDNPISKSFDTIDYILGNPPYNRNIAKKEEVSKELWDPSGYTTKLAYCIFVVLAHKLLKKDGILRYIMPCSFSHNENTEFFRQFLKNNFEIKKIKVLPPDVFDKIMIRTCLFEANKGSQKNDILIERHWNDKWYNCHTNYNQYNEIPLFIGDISKNIYEKVMQLNMSPTAYKGWNGADSYAKFISKNPNKYPYQYVNNFNKKKVEIFSSLYPDKFKAKVNKKKNNIGNYNRFTLPKIIINEVMFNSFETDIHIKYLLIDRNGKFGLSPKNTMVTLNVNDIDDYAEDLSSKVAQLMLSIMKDYNHNDSKLFRYLPLGLSKIDLTEEEKQFLENFSNFKSIVEL